MASPPVGLQLRQDLDTEVRPTPDPSLRRIQSDEELLGKGTFGAPSIAPKVPPAREGPESIFNELLRGIRASTEQSQAAEFAREARGAELKGNIQLKNALLLKAADHLTEAQRVGPTVKSYKDISDIGEAIRFGLGLTGESALSISLSVGGGAVGRVAGGVVRNLPGVKRALADSPKLRNAIDASASFAGASIPMYGDVKGGVILSQEFDPTIAAQPVGDRERAATLTALASTSLEALVPAAIGRRVGRRVLSRQKLTLADIAGKKGRGDFYRDIIGEGLTEVGQEHLEQFALHLQNPELAAYASSEDAINSFFGGVAGGSLGHTVGRSLEGLTNLRDRVKPEPGRLGIFGNISLTPNVRTMTDAFRSEPFSKDAIEELDTVNAALQKLGIFDQLNDLGGTIDAEGNLNISPRNRQLADGLNAVLQANTSEAQRPLVIAMYHLNQAREDNDGPAYIEAKENYIQVMTERLIAQGNNSSEARKFADKHFESIEKRITRTERNIQNDMNAEVFSGQAEANQMLERLQFRDDETGEILGTDGIIITDENNALDIDAHHLLGAGVEGGVLTGRWTPTGNAHTQTAARPADLSAPELSASAIYLQEPLSEKGKANPLGEGTRGFEFKNLIQRLIDSPFSATLTNPYFAPGERYATGEVDENGNKKFAINKVEKKFDPDRVSLITYDQYLNAANQHQGFSERDNFMEAAKNMILDLQLRIDGTKLDHVIKRHQEQIKELQTAYEYEKANPTESGEAQSKGHYFEESNKGEAYKNAEVNELNKALEVKATELEVAQTKTKELIAARKKMWQKGVTHEAVREQNARDMDTALRTEVFIKAKMREISANIQKVGKANKKQRVKSLKELFTQRYYMGAIKKQEFADVEQPGVRATQRDLSKMQIGLKIGDLPPALAKTARKEAKGRRISFLIRVPFAERLVSNQPAYRIIHVDPVSVMLVAKENYKLRSNDKAVPKVHELISDGLSSIFNMPATVGILETDANNDFVHHEEPIADKFDLTKLEGDGLETEPAAPEGRTIEERTVRGMPLKRVVYNKVRIKAAIKGDPGFRNVVVTNRLPGRALSQRSGRFIGYYSGDSVSKNKYWLDKRESLNNQNSPAASSLLEAQFLNDILEAYNSSEEYKISEVRDFWAAVADSFTTRREAVIFNPDEDTTVTGINSAIRTGAIPATTLFQTLKKINERIVTGSVDRQKQTVLLEQIAVINEKIKAYKANPAKKAQGPLTRLKNQKEALRKKLENAVLISEMDHFLDTNPKTQYENLEQLLIEHAPVDKKEPLGKFYGSIQALFNMRSTLDLKLTALNAELAAKTGNRTSPYALTGIDRTVVQLRRHQIEGFRKGIDNIISAADARLFSTTVENLNYVEERDEFIGGHEPRKTPSQKLAIQELLDRFSGKTHLALQHDIKRIKQLLKDSKEEQTYKSLKAQGMSVLRKDTSKEEATFQVKNSAGEVIAQALINIKGEFVHSIEVYGHRIDGIENALYDHIETKLGFTLKPSTRVTEAGIGLWRRRNPGAMRGYKYTAAEISSLKLPKGSERIRKYREPRSTDDFSGMEPGTHYQTNYGSRNTNRKNKNYGKANLAILRKERTGLQLALQKALGRQAAALELHLELDLRPTHEGITPRLKAANEVYNKALQALTKNTQAIQAILALRPLTRVQKTQLRAVLDYREAELKRITSIQRKGLIPAPITPSSIPKPILGDLSMPAIRNAEVSRIREAFAIAAKALSGLRASNIDRKLNNAEVNYIKRAYAFITDIAGASGVNTTKLRYMAADHSAYLLLAKMPANKTLAHINEVIKQRGIIILGSESKVNPKNFAEFMRDAGYISDPIKTNVFFPADPGMFSRNDATWAAQVATYLTAAKAFIAGIKKGEKVEDQYNFTKSILWRLNIWHTGPVRLNAKGAGAFNTSKQERITLKEYGYELKREPGGTTVYLISVGAAKQARKLAKREKQDAEETLNAIENPLAPKLTPEKQAEAEKENAETRKKNEREREDRDQKAAEAMAKTASDVQKDIKTALLNITEWHTTKAREEMRRFFDNVGDSPDAQRMSRDLRQSLWTNKRVRAKMAWWLGEFAKGENSPRTKENLRERFGITKADLDRAAIDPSSYYALAFQIGMLKDKEGNPLLNLSPRTNQWFKHIIEAFLELIGIAMSHKFGEAMFVAMQNHKLTGREDIHAFYRENNLRNNQKLEDISYQVRRYINQTITAAPDVLRKLNSPAAHKLADLFAIPEFKGGKDVLEGFLPRRRRQNDVWHNKLRKEILNKFSDTDFKEGWDQYQNGLPVSAAAKAIELFVNQVYGYLDTSNARVTVYEKGHFITVAPKERVWKVPMTFKIKEVADNRVKLEALLVQHGLDQDKAHKLVDSILWAGGHYSLVDSEFDQGQNPVSVGSFSGLLQVINKKNVAAFKPFLSEDGDVALLKFTRQAVHKAESAKSFGHDGKEIHNALRSMELGGLNTHDLRYIRDRVIPGMLGTLAYKMSPRMREIQGTILSIQNMAILPFMIFPAMVDIWGVTMQTGEMVDAWKIFKGGLREIIRTFAKDPDARTQLAELLGIITDRNVLDRVGDTHNELMDLSLLRKMNQKFFYATGIEQWTKGTRIAAMQAGLKYFAKWKNDREKLDLFGLSVGDIKLDKDNNIIDLTTNDKLGAAINQFVDSAILRPSAAHRPAWGSDPYYLLIWHLKQFTFTFHKVFLDKILNEMDKTNPNYKILLPFIMLLPTMMVSDAIKNIIAPSAFYENMSMTEHITHSVARSSMLGIGTFGLDVLKDSEFGKLPGSSLLGPTVDSIYRFHDKGLAEGLFRLTPGYAALNRWFN